MVVKTGAPGNISTRVSSTASAPPIWLSQSWTMATFTALGAPWTFGSPQTLGSLLTLRGLRTLGSPWPLRGPWALESLCTLRGRRPADSYRPLYCEIAAGQQIVVDVEFQPVISSAHHPGEDIGTVGAAPPPGLLAPVELDAVKVPDLGPCEAVAHPVIREGGVHPAHRVGKDSRRADRFAAVGDLHRKVNRSYLYPGRGRDRAADRGGRGRHTRGCGRRCQGKGERGGHRGRCGRWRRGR